VHEEAEEAQVVRAWWWMALVVARGVAREGAGGVTGVQRHPEAELKLALVRPVRSRYFTAVPLLHSSPAMRDGHTT
jgi:hypothetical protein